MTLSILRGALRHSLHLGKSRNSPHIRLRRPVSFLHSGLPVITTIQFYNSPVIPPQVLLAVTPSPDSHVCDLVFHCVYPFTLTIGLMLGRGMQIISPVITAGLCVGMCFLVLFLIRSRFCLFVCLPDVAMHTPSHSACGAKAERLP